MEEFSAEEFERSLENIPINILEEVFKNTNIFNGKNHRTDLALEDLRLIILKRKMEMV